MKGVLLVFVDCDDKKRIHILCVVTVYEKEQVMVSTYVGTITFFMSFIYKCEFYVWKLRKFDVIVTFEVINVTYYCLLYFIQ